MKLHTSSFPISHKTFEILVTLAQNRIAFKREPLQDIISMHMSIEKAKSDRFLIELHDRNDFVETSAIECNTDWFETTVDICGDIFWVNHTLLGTSKYRQWNPICDVKMRGQKESGPRECASDRGFDKNLRYYREYARLMGQCICYWMDHGKWHCCQWELQFALLIESVRFSLDWNR